MKRKKDREHSVDFLFALVTFLIYAGAMILLVYMGVVVYRSVTGQMEQHYATRTAQAYITEKIRQNDQAGAITVEQVEERRVLAFWEMVEEKQYVTYIYEDDGKLKELFMAADSGVSLNGGTEILELQGFDAEELSGGGFQITITDSEDRARSFVIYQDSEAAGRQDSERGGKAA